MNENMVTIVTALISGFLTLAGTAVTAWAAAGKTRSGLETGLALLEQKLTGLTEEQKRITDSLKRIPVLEERMEGLSTRQSRLEADGRKRHWGRREA